MSKIQVTQRLICRQILSYKSVNHEISMKPTHCRESSGTGCSTNDHFDDSIVVFHTEKCEQTFVKYIHAKQCGNQVSCNFELRFLVNDHSIKPCIVSQRFQKNAC